MLFHHTQGFMQEAWFQALKLFQSQLRPDLSMTWPFTWRTST